MAEAVRERKRGLLSRLRAGLARTAGSLGEGLAGIVTRRKLDRAALDEIEDLLIASDLGVATSAAVTKKLAAERLDKEISTDEVKQVLVAEIATRLGGSEAALEIDPARKPHVILVAGVNGTGKTTTIGKLAARFRAEGKRVYLAAADTFRAAAIEQLKVWAERADATMVSGKVGGDAAGLVYEALEQARAAAADVLLIDTAGRLQNKADLMAELSKMVRVIGKIDDSAPHSVLLVLDATTGQNAHRQVELFQDACDVTGLIMTKLDGTARGGVLVALAERFGLPVHAIGVGEGIDDLQPFDAQSFARALAGVGGDGD